MRNVPKITVIIPTRERCDVLESSLLTVTSQDYENLEIIVSDNFSEDATSSVVSRANDSRIKYVNPGKRISMSHNWEFALSHVQDGWVTFVGDDDGLLPESLFTVADIIEKTHVKAIRTNFCTYDWPSVSGNRHGQLIVPMTSGLEIRKTGHWLSKVMHGRAKYSQLPMIYNGGFIHISILQEIRKKMGAYFLSASPDIYSALAISRVIDSYAYSREPLVITGTSKHSNGHSSFSRSGHQSELPLRKFTSEQNLPFHEHVPLCNDGSYPLSLQASVYEAYLQSDLLGNRVKKISPSQQLEIIMALAGKHRSSIEKWGELFAKKHDINYTLARLSASRKRAVLQPFNIGRKIINAANSVITETLPIKNIFEASIAASVIKTSSGKKDTMRYLARQLIKGISHR